MGSIEQWEMPDPSHDGIEDMCIHTERKKGWYYKRGSVVRLSFIFTNSAEDKKKKKN